MGACHSVLMKNKKSSGDFQSNLVRTKHGEDYEDEYELVNTKLGEGITGNVVKVVSKLNGQFYAMKSINISRFDKHQLKELKREIEMVRNLDHPNIIKFYKVFKSDSKNLHIIMDLLTGGELLSRFPKNGGQVAKLASQLLNACKYWHSRNIVHRDLKPENIMYTTAHPNSDIQVIDFGLSTWFAINFTQEPAPSRLSSFLYPSNSSKDEQKRKKTKTRKFHASSDGANYGEFPTDGKLPVKRSRNNKLKRILMSQVGSYFYMAPELFNGKGYDYKVDIWAIGVILYLLITRKLPFLANSGEEIARLVQQPPSYDSNNWNIMPPEAKDLVQNLLKVDPEERYSADQALKCKWLRDYEKKLKQNKRMSGRELESLQLEKEVVKSFRRFQTYTKLKKAAFMVIAHKASSAQISKLREMFHQLDINKTGTITHDELRVALQRHNIVGEEVNALFKDLDQDKSGQIRYMEFLAATIETQKHISAQEMSIAFDHLDTDSSGYITAKNLRSLLGREFSNEDVEEIIKESDLTNDGQVAKDEFMKIMTTNQNKLLIQTMKDAENGDCKNESSAKDLKNGSQSSSSASTPNAKEKPEGVINADTSTHDVQTT